MVVGAALAARRRHESAAEVSNMDRMLSVRNHTEYRFVVSGIQARESVTVLLSSSSQLCDTQLPPASPGGARVGARRGARAASQGSLALARGQGGGARLGVPHPARIRDLFLDLSWTFPGTSL